MLQVFPDYYKHFQCIGETCRHNCCIGWEIDIDPDTAAFYQTVDGQFGEQLKQHISQDDPPHFILDARDRCPFLNCHNLCDIILTLGESHICGICTDHPRFRNELPGRVETGLGLCCEEAARLILSWKPPVKLELSDIDNCDDAIIQVRDNVICALQDRTRSIPQRVNDMLELCCASAPSPDPGHWAALLLELERLDESWTETVSLLLNHWEHADLAGFDRHMAARQTEYEQFLVYIVYRHLANAFDEDSLAERASFAALSRMLLHRLGAVIWTLTGQFTFEQQVELARMFSSEIEYSQDNLDRIFDELSFA